MNNDYVVGVPVMADTPEKAREIIGTALGFDQNSVHEIGSLTVELVPEEKMYLVCKGCGEAFDSISAAHEHGVFIAGADPTWCGEDGFDLVPRARRCEHRPGPGVATSRVGVQSLRGEQPRRCPEPREQESPSQASD